MIMLSLLLSRSKFVTLVEMRAVRTYLLSAADAVMVQNTRKPASVSSFWSLNIVLLIAQHPFYLLVI